MRTLRFRYNDFIMGAIAFQINSLTIIHSAVHSDADQRKHQSSASLAFVWGNHRAPVNSLHKWPVKREMFPFDDVIMLDGVSKKEMNSHIRNSQNVACVSNTHLSVYSISQEIWTRLLLCCALLWLYIDWFPHIHQAYFTGTVAI